MDVSQSMHCACRFSRMGTREAKETRLTERPDAFLTAFSVADRTLVRRLFQRLSVTSGSPSALLRAVRNECEEHLQEWGNCKDIRLIHRLLQTLRERREAAAAYARRILNRRRGTR